MATFTNQAQITYNGTTLNSNVVTGELTAVLSAEKAAVTGEYSRGDDVTFVISIVNSGTIPYTGLTVTDNLGAYSFGDPAAEDVNRFWKGIFRIWSILKIFSEPHKSGISLSYILPKVPPFP